MKKGTIIGALLCYSILTFTGCGAGNQSYSRGMELAQQGDYKKAAGYLERAIEENGERAEYYIGYGMVLNAQGQYEKALEQFGRAFQDVKNSIANANNKQIYFGQAISYYHLSEYDKSLACCDKALELEEPASLDVDILCSKGAVLETAGETDEALEIYGQAIKKDPENWQAYLKRASLEERMGRQEDAGADYQKVIQGDGRERFEACFKMYALCQVRKDPDTSAQVLKEVIETKEKDAFAYCQVGWAYHLQGRDGKAQEYLEKSRKDGYTEAGYYLGMMAMAGQDYAKAKSLFEEYLSSGQGRLQAMAYNQLAGCALEGDDMASAQAYLEEGMNLADNSSRPYLWKNQIILLEKQGLFGQAKRSAQAYLAAYPQDRGMKRELKFIRTRKTKKKAEKKTFSKGDAAAGSSGESSPAPGQTEEPERTALEEPGPESAMQEMIQE